MTTPSAQLRPARPSEPMVADFTRSIPPLTAELGAGLADAMTEMAVEHSDGLVLRETKSGGDQRDREQASRWIAPRFVLSPDPGRILLTNGNQSSFQLVARHVAGIGGAVLTEQLTYGVIDELAYSVGVRLVPLAIDEEGLVPDAFEQAARAGAGQLLYCNPTNHNPTTAIMSAERRLHIGRIAERYGIQIFEDDVLGRLHPDAPPPIAASHPDLTWYSMGLTKCLAQGLRVGYLVCPSVARRNELTAPTARLSDWVANPLATSIVRRWIEDGRAESITASIRAEAVKRQALAAQALPSARYRAGADSLHLWLTVPEGQNADEFARGARQLGVHVRPSSLFCVGENAQPNKVRLSLSTPRSRDEVAAGLDVIASLI
ncbi:PLP-dependent aminotransferase family protein [Kribbella sp. NPDC050820]|uniref:aminotransferase-like domain-containing protein n=1 Tax=Kribbella sp. NPDC050820 TaxID=3155408 RepID=UPI0033CC0A93